MDSNINFLASEKALHWFIHYLSFTPSSYKIGLVKTLLHWAFVISNNWYIFHLEKTKELLEKNLYPSNFIDQQIKQYFHDKFSDKKHKELVILHMFHITNNLTLEICWQKLKKKLSNIVNIVVKVLISKLSFRHLKLKICLLSKNQCLSI